MVKSLISGNQNVTLLKTLDSQQITQRWKRELDTDVGEKFASLGKIEYWICHDTGLRWYEPPSAAGDGNLYRQLEKFDWYYMPNKWEFERTLHYFKPNSSILEVGSGRGHFLKLAQNAGHSVVGVELNPKAAAFARTQGFTVFEKQLSDLAEDDHKFDYVCAFQVLEHLSNPRQFLEEAIRLVKPDGCIIVSTPNHHFMQKVDPDNQDLLNQPPHHMSHWDAEVFYSLESYLPLKVISIEYKPLASYHVSWFVNAYLRNRFPINAKNLKRVVINRYTTLPIQLILQAGLRKLINGHTILVKLMPNH